MYNELYDAWQAEIENSRLGHLPPDFFLRMAKYLRQIKEEENTKQTKNVRTTLIEHEMANARRMVQELISARNRKIMKIIMTGQKIPSDSMATEERDMLKGIAYSGEAYAKFTSSILEGHPFKLEADVKQVETGLQGRVTVRFIKPVPSIIGADMKSYGPFLNEDVASVPLENAKILVKQSLAKLLELH